MVGGAGGSGPGTRTTPWRTSWVAGFVPTCRPRARRLSSTTTGGWTEDPGLCVAVYDWDMATRGDPLADVGTLMASWYEEAEERSTLAPMPTTAPGWMSRDEALQRYGDLSGRDLSDIDWYVVFGTWKLGVVLQQIHIRWLRGQTSLTMSIQVDTATLST